MNTYFAGHTRFDLGLQDPNKTALLLVLLALSSWGLALWKPKLFWSSLVISVVLGIGLLHTYSRGGLMAMFGGAGVLILFRPLRLSRVQVIALVVTAISFFAYARCISATRRWFQPVVQQDRSVSNRLDIWKTVPHMMVDAPEGWGIGQSGRAYMSWYQDPGRIEMYRALVSSHFTWLVEIGWIGRFFYILVWCLCFTICWPLHKRHWFCLPLAILTAFFVGATFSAVAEVPALWVLPACALVVVIQQRVRLKEGIRLKLLAAGFALCSLLLTAWIIYGTLHSEPVSIHGDPNLTIIQSGPASKNAILVVGTDSDEVGLHYGQAVRVELQKRSISEPLRIGFTPHAAEAMPFDCSCMVFVGNECPAIGDLQARKLKGLQKIILINPSKVPEELLRQASAECPLDVILGEFSSRVTTTEVSAWNAQPYVRVHIIAGVGDYNPDWFQMVLGLIDKRA